PPGLVPPHVISMISPPELTRDHAAGGRPPHAPRAGSARLQVDWGRDLARLGGHWRSRGGHPTLALGRPLLGGHSCAALLRDLERYRAKRRLRSCSRPSWVSEFGPQVRFPSSVPELGYPSSVSRFGPPSLATPAPSWQQRREMLPMPAWSRLDSAWPQCTLC